MLNTLKRLLLIASLSLVFTGNAIASDEGDKPSSPVDIACSVAFLENGDVKPEDMTLCNQDVGLNAVTLSMSSVMRDNPSASGLAAKMGVTLPMYSESVNFISRPIGAVAAATVDICLTIIIIAAFYRLLMFGYRGMKDSSIERVVRDPSTYKAFAGFGLVVLLSVKFGDINLAQLLVISCALFGLKIATFLFSSMVAVFNFDSHHNAVIDSYEEFLPHGEEYASTLIHGIYGAQEAALRTNFANIMHEDAQMLTDDEDKSWIQGIVYSIFKAWGYSTQDPTVNEYFDGIFHDTSISLSQSSGLQFPQSVRYDNYQSGQLVVAGSTFGALTLNDSRLDEKKKNSFTSPMFEKAFGYRDLFHNATTVNLGSVLPPSLPPKLVSKIATSSAVANLSSLMISDIGGENDDEKSRIVSAGDKLVELMTQIQSENPSMNINPNDIIAVYQAIAYGAMSAEAAASGGVRTEKLMFSPFVGTGEFRSKYLKQSEPFHYVLLEALNSAKEMRKFNCISNFSDTALEFTFWADLDDNGGSSSMNDELNKFSDSEFYPICTMPTANGNAYEIIAPEVMSKEALQVAKLIKDGKAGSTNLAQILRNIEEAAKNTSQGTAEEGSSSGTLGGAALENAKFNKQAIAAYYARVAAISRYAALQMVYLNKGDDKLAFLKNMRQQGAVAASSYFMQLSKESEKYSNIIYNSAPKVEIKSNLREGGNLPLVTDKWETDDVLVKKKANFPKTEALFKQSLNAGNSDMMATSNIGDTAVADEMGAVSEFMAVVADWLVPSQDVLMQGFGIENHDTLTEGLASCTTTTNCVEFKQHPLVTVSIFGKDLLITGVMIVLIDQIIKTINNFMGNDDDEKNSDGKLTDTLKRFAFKTVLGSVAGVMQFISILSSIVAIFGSVYILVGIFLGYIVPMLPYIAQLMMWLSWFAEFLLLFLSIPLLVAFAFIVKEDGQALFKPTSIISMLASLVLRAPLIFIAFMVFYTLSYAGIYMVNSTLFTMFKAEIVGAGFLGGLMSLFGIVIFLVFTMGMYFLIFKTLTKVMTELPDHVLRPLGVESLNVQVSAGLEAFIAARSISQIAEKTTRASGNAGAVGGKGVYDLATGKSGKEGGGDDNKGGKDEKGGESQPTQRTGSDEAAPQQSAPPAQEEGGDKAKKGKDKPEE